jgi:plasmid replication initiation protein
MAIASGKQLDLFIATASDVSSKEHQDLMARNWFSLAKQKRTETIEHYFGENWIKIEADARYGIATIFDNDILIFVITQYIAALNDNLSNSTGLSRNFNFTGYQYFNFIGRKRFGGKAYSDLWKSLERLHHTFVKTNIRLGEAKRNHSFTWLSDIKQEVRNGRHEGYTIRVADWLYESVMDRRMVLTLDDEYFNIKGGLERWLYLFSRKTSGHQVGGWTESRKNIYIKSGSKSTYAEFNRQLSKIVKKNNLLGYKIEEVEGIGRNAERALNFVSNTELVQIASQGRQRRGALQFRKDR